LPTRLRFKELARRHIPHSQAIDRANVDLARGVDVGFLVSVVERWRGATMSGRTKASGDEASEFDDLETLAGQEFGRIRPLSETSAAQAPSLAPPAQPLAGTRSATTAPDSYYFPVEAPPRQPFSKLRK
jgi:hypothetical protein